MSGVATAVRIVTAGPSQVSDFVQLWVPYHVYLTMTDTTWNYRIFPWEAIITAGPGQGVITYAAVASSKTEGMIAIERVRGAQRLKVRFLSTAPWNYGQSKTRRGVGSGLLACAVQISKADGFDGCELSATPEAETFYERMEWERTGQRDHEDLPIFRLAGSKVDGFLAKHPPLPTT